MNQTLLIIDAQQALMDGNQEVSSIYNKEQVIRNINKVIQKARDASISIVFVRDLDVANGKGNGFDISNSTGRIGCSSDV
ncbi:isochorismatase family protein [Gracilibacillus salinarum]|uniref:Isochorismatase family protein n=1 Tax=Gracilibacillus salinarum TaxID=2932255 RepID=A0ABY4GNS4_9BACI|nr:isochorismatase family protein [Gracilibacillus salinarum]UOQ85815.1 isochorismatase family protein [Gracilibacillus salinarum]